MKKVVLFFTLALSLILTPNLLPADDVPISNFKIISFRGEWQGDTLLVIGEIKNIGKIPAGVKIEVIARDLKGVLIDTKKFWPNSINNILPGRSCGIKHLITENTRAKKIEIQIIRAQTW